MRFVLTLFAALLSTLASAQGGGGWRPEKPIEVIVGAAPGGANDRVGRTIQQVLQTAKLVTTPVNVVNKPGGGQSIAMVYLNSHPGDAHFVALASASWFTTVVAGRGTVTHRDLTPIAKLFDEYQVYFVRTDSPIRNMRDLGERLKKDSLSVSFGFSTAIGNPLHVSIANVARAAGADPGKLKTVVFNSGTDTSAQVAGGHLDIGVQSPGSIAQLQAAGKVRAIGVAAPQRLAGPLAEVPTLREQGLDVIASVFYLILLPRGVSAAQVAFWDDAIARMLKAEEFRASLERNQWTPDYIGQREIGAFLERQHGELRRTLTDIGLMKP